MILILIGVIGIAVIYASRHKGPGAKVPTGATTTAVLPNASLDGSGQAVVVATQVQTEAAYNVQPTVMSDAFGSGENVGGTPLSSDEM